jgi:CRP-like cAMP-binding protein
LTEADRALLQGLATDAVAVPGNRDLIREGEEPSAVPVVLEGFACRYRTLPDGGRQIIGWLAPGDFCDLHVSILGQMDHSVRTLTASRIAHLPRDGLDALTEGRPALMRAFWWATLVDEAVLREWLINLGRRSALVRISHLLCETLVRLRAVGLAPGDAFDFPLTQVELADTAGLSPVHVNRIVQHLREEELIAWRGRTLTILRPDALRRLAGFNPGYLHLDSAQRNGRGPIPPPDPAH